MEEEQDVLTTTTTTTTSICNEDLPYARRLLYLSHFASQFAEWAWQFSLVIWLAALSNYSSLFLVSLYQATAQLMVLGLVPQLSKFIDITATRNGGHKQPGIASSNCQQLNRSQFASILITAQNVCVFIATVTIGFTMSRVDSKNIDNTDTIQLMIICLFGGLAQVLDKTFIVAVERDWIVVMAGEHDPSTGQSSWLQETNVSLKQMDLTCQVLGPSISGWVLACGGGVGVGWIGGCTILSLITEFLCMKRIYQLVPSLQQEGKIPRTLSGESLETPCEQEHVREEAGIIESKAGCHNCQNLLQVYASQTMAWAGLGLALLYFNVLTFSGMMTAYLVSCGMSLSAIGIWRGVASLIGLLGTFIFTQSQTKFHLELETTALWSLVWEFAWLTLSLCSIFVNNDTQLAATLLIAGVLPSRIGLWVYDISVTQLFQQTVASNVRGQVGGTQMSMNAFFECLPFVLGMVYSDVREFWILMVGGYASVGLAMLLFLLGIYLPHKRCKKQDYSFEPVHTKDKEETLGDVQLMDSR